MIVYCGIQYEIYLDKPVDFYNDILPIWIEVRERIELKPVIISLMTNFTMENITKLIVLEESKLYDRFKICVYANEYLQNYHDSGCYTGSESDKKNLDKIKYNDVKYYNTFIKNNKNLPNPITPYEFFILENKLNELEKKLDNNFDGIELLDQNEYIEIKNEFDNLLPVYRLQRIIALPEYFEEIKSIDYSLTNIELTQDEKTLIDKIINHPNIKNSIHSHGFHLVDGYY